MRVSAHARARACVGRGGGLWLGCVHVSTPCVARKGYAKHCLFTLDEMSETKNSSHAQHGTHSMAGAVPTAWRGVAVDIVRPLVVHPLYVLFLSCLCFFPTARAGGTPSAPASPLSRQQSHTSRPADGLCRGPRPYTHRLPTISLLWCRPEPHRLAIRPRQRRASSNTVTCHDFARHPASASPARESAHPVHLTGWGHLCNGRSTA